MLEGVDVVAQHGKCDVDLAIQRVGTGRAVVVVVLVREEPEGIVIVDVDSLQTAGKLRSDGALRNGKGDGCASARGSAGVVAGVYGF